MAEELRQRLPREHSESHLRFVRQLPCLVCGNDIETEAAHVKYSDLNRNKRYIGVAEKADDKWVLPQCGRCHRRQHGMNERQFWADEGIDPLAVCERLFAETGDYAAGLAIIAAART